MQGSDHSDRSCGNSRVGRESERDSRGPADFNGDGGAGHFATITSTAWPSLYAVRFAPISDSSPVRP